MHNYTVIFYYSYCFIILNVLLMQCSVLMIDTVNKWYTVCEYGYKVYTRKCRGSWKTTPGTVVYRLTLN